MEHTETRLAWMIGARVKELRARNGLTAQKLADALASEGVPWERGTVTKLETRRRDNVTVNELLALAKVLNVAPVHLLVPLEDDQPMPVTPETMMQAGHVREWVRARKALPGTDLRIFRTEVPLSELAAKREFFETLADRGDVDRDVINRINPEMGLGRKRGDADG